MCADEKTWLESSIPNSTGTSSSQRTSSSSRQRRKSSIQEEMRFAGWFWRSSEEKSPSSRWKTWIISIFLTGLASFLLLPLIGLRLTVLLFLILQSLVTLSLVFGGRQVLHTLLGRVRRSSLNKSHRIYPLADVEFYLAPGQDIVLLSHKSGLSATGLIVIDKLPIGIRGNMSAFIRAIYSAGVPLFYSLVHAPIPDHNLHEYEALSDNAQNTLASLDPPQRSDLSWQWGGVWKTRLLLGTRRDSSQHNGNATEEKLVQQVQQDLQTLFIAFRTAYPHIRLQQLSGRELEDGIRSILLLGKPPHFF